MNCVHTDQDGLLTRAYRMDGAPTLANQKLDMLGDNESSDDECQRCLNKRISCCGSQPCSRCVRDHQNPDKHVSGCNWRRRGVLLERYMVEPYTLDDENRLILKENHTDIIAAARARGRLSSAATTVATNEKRKRKHKMAEQTVSPLSQESDPDLEDDRTTKVAMTIKSDQRLPDPGTFNEAMRSGKATFGARL